MADPIITKWCPTCQARKPITEFHRNRSKLDGHSHQCKDCFRTAHKVYRQSPLGKVTRLRANSYPATKKAKRRYDKSEKGKAHHKAFSQTPAGRLCTIRAARKFAAANPEKLRAHWRIHELVRQGKLQTARHLPCVRCAKQATQYHHHNGYDITHIVDVIPVCAKCHAILDNRVIYT